MKEKISWSNYDWITKLSREPRYNDTKRKFWYDGSCVNVDATGRLHLTTQRSPKQFPIGKPIIGAGLISSVQSFSHGIFNIQCIFPKGKYLWPAFWGIGAQSWPPEIDVFEGYSDKNGSYAKFDIFNPFAKWCVETNAWYGTPNNPKNIGSKQHSQLKNDPSSAYEYYTLEWTPDQMKLIFGSKEVRIIKDKEILSKFNDQGLTIILNNGVTNDAADLDSHISSDFIVNYFSYKQF